MSAGAQLADLIPAMVTNRTVAFVAEARAQANHHIIFVPSLIKRILRVRRDEFRPLSDGFLELAVEWFLSLRERGLQKPPSTGELLMWLRVLAAAGNVSEARLREADPLKLPYLSVLLKNRQDLLDEE